MQRADSGSGNGRGGSASNALQHLMSASRRGRIIRSDKSPLYFQHGALPALCVPHLTTIVFHCVNSILLK